MSKRKIMSIVGLGLMVLMLICLFLPFVSMYGQSTSYWDGLESQKLNIIVLIELIIGIAVLSLQIAGILKDGNFSLFAVGYYLTDLIAMYLSASENKMTEYLAFGYYLGLIASLAALVVIVIGYFMSDEKPQMNGPYNPQGPMGYNQPNPQMGGQPYYNQQPQIIGYNQQGQPIYKQ